MEQTTGALFLRPIDYREPARQRMRRPVWDYLEGGSGDEVTVDANIAAFDAMRIVPRVLVDVSRCSPRTRVLGADLALPVGVAPMAYQSMFHPDGELAMARGAGATGALCVVSMFASRRVEDVARVADGPLWLQVYWLRDRAVLAELVGRAAKAGFRAVVLTVDAPRFGQRLRDVRNAFAVPPDVHPVNLPAGRAEGAGPVSPAESPLAARTNALVDPTVTWADLAWLQGLTPLPVLLKGVLSAHDARLAVEHGVAGIIVSNHGGRQLDGAVTSLEALADVVDAVAGRAAVLMDGGVRRGRDVFLALALGANAVLVGRPAMWALTVGGANAVTRALHLLRDELTTTMALAGRPRVADIDRTGVSVYRERPRPGGYPTDGSAR